jgi:hypothetical protein
MPDAGFFLDHNTSAGESASTIQLSRFDQTHLCSGQPYYTPLYRTVASMQNVTVPGSVNDACLAHYTPTGDTWRCFMAQYTLPFITTPFFMTQATNS